MHGFITGHWSFGKYRYFVSSRVSPCFYQYLLIPWLHRNIPVILRNCHVHSYWPQAFQSCDFYLKTWLSLLATNIASYTYSDRLILFFLEKTLTKIEYLVCHFPSKWKWLLHDRWSFAPVMAAAWETSQNRHSVLYAV